MHCWTTYLAMSLSDLRCVGAEGFWEGLDNAVVRSAVYSR